MFYIFSLPAFLFKAIRIQKYTVDFSFCGYTTRSIFAWLCDFVATSRQVCTRPFPIVLGHKVQHCMRYAVRCVAPCQSAGIFLGKLFGGIAEAGANCRRAFFTKSNLGFCDVIVKSSTSLTQPR